MQLVICLFIYSEIFSTSLLTHCSQKNYCDLYTNLVGEHNEFNST